MRRSLGFVETKGLIGAIEAADAMVKAAHVQLVKRHRTGGALVTVFVEGELADCQAAVKAGCVAAARCGELICAHVIARPYPDTATLVEQILSRNKQ